MVRKITSLNKEEIIELLKKSKSIHHALGNIGVNAKGSGAYKIFKKHCNKNGVDINENSFNSDIKKRKVTPKYSINEILVKDSNYQNIGRLKIRLVNEKLKSYKCDLCDIVDKWNGKSLSLHLDHINGINDDHRLENLRFLCPNCHSQTKTYGGKNIK